MKKLLVGSLSLLTVILSSCQHSIDNPNGFTNGRTHTITPVTLSPTTLSSTEPTSGQRLKCMPYYYYTLNIFKCMDVYGASMDNQVYINLYPDEGDCAGQVFNFHYLYTLENGNPVWAVECEHSGKYWDMEYDSQLNGARLNQYTQVPDCLAQEFELIEVETAVYKIKARHSGKIFDVYGASTEDGTPIVQWTDENHVAQLFVFYEP